MALIDVNWKPGTRELRQFGGLFFLFAEAIGCLAYFDIGLFAGLSPLLPKALWIGGAVVGLATLVLPKSVQPIYVVMMAIALPVGYVVSMTLMIVIYFLVMTPIGVLMRLFGYDPMGKQFDSSASTYWIKRTPRTDAGYYFRQY